MTERVPNWGRRRLLATVSTAAFAPPARAQEVLPRPEQPFKGHIGRTVKESTKDFPKRSTRPRARRTSCSS